MPRAGEIEMGSTDDIYLPPSCNTQPVRHGQRRCEIRTKFFPPALFFPRSGGRVGADSLLSVARPLARLGRRRYVAFGVLNGRGPAKGRRGQREFNMLAYGGYWIAALEPEGSVVCLALFLAKAGRREREVSQGDGRTRHELHMGVRVGGCDLRVVKAARLRRVVSGSDVWGKSTWRVATWRLEACS